jgi:hypothetical protein
MNQPSPDNRGLRDQVREWTAIHHFTIALPDTSDLLRRVADAIDELGDVEVYDVTFKADDELQEKRVTVYFVFRDNPKPGDPTENSQR